MSFNVLFLAHAPDADPKIHRCAVETGKYRLFVVVVRDQGQAVEVVKEMVPREGIHSILLCPGFTHRDVAEIAQVAGSQVGVSVARGDGPANRTVAEIMRKENWFGKK